MLSTLASMAAAVVGAFGSLFKWMTQSDARKAAKAEGQAEFMRETINDVDKANRAKRRLADNPDHADGVRKRFTRPD